MEETSIYILKDPVDTEVRYVGLTQKPLITRLREHLYCKRYNPHKVYWIRKLLRLGRSPEIILLEKTTTPQEAERYYIKLFREMGHRLLNVTDGGDGTFGFRFSEESRQRMSETRRGKPKPPGFGEQVSRRCKGRPAPWVSEVARRACSKPIVLQGVSYPSVTAAASALQVSRKTIRNRLKREQK